MKRVDCTVLEQRRGLRRRPDHATRIGVNRSNAGTGAYPVRDSSAMAALTRVSECFAGVATAQEAAVARLPCHGSNRSAASAIRMLGHRLPAGSLLLPGRPAGQAQLERREALLCRRSSAARAATRSSSVTACQRVPRPAPSRRMRPVFSSSRRPASTRILLVRVCSATSEVLSPSLEARTVSRPSGVSGEVRDPSRRAAARPCGARRRGARLGGMVVASAARACSSDCISALTSSMRWSMEVAKSWRKFISRDPRPVRLVSAQRSPGPDDGQPASRVSDAGARASASVPAATDSP